MPTDETPSAGSVARDTAVQLVDGLYGYTMEFAPSPAEHRQRYKMAEDAIALALDAFACEREAAVRESAAKIAEQHEDHDGSVHDCGLEIADEIRKVTT